MKIKQYSMLTLVLGLITVSSCKKEYTCGCLQTTIVPAYSYNGQNYPQEISFYSFENKYKAKKKDSESICSSAESINSYPSTYASQGQGQTVETITCELK